MVDGDEDKKDEAEFKPKSDDDGGEEEKDDDEVNEDVNGDGSKKRKK